MDFYIPQLPVPGIRYICIPKSTLVQPDHPVRVAGLGSFGLYRLEIPVVDWILFLGFRLFICSNRLFLLSSKRYIRWSQVPSIPFRVFEWNEIERNDTLKAHKVSSGVMFYC